MRIIGEFVHTLPRKPGVYRMIAADGEVLYVGKARSLQKPRRRLHPADAARHPPACAWCRRRATMEFVGHRQRGRGAAAREQPDQALPAALQRAAARRQVVSLHRHPPRHRMAAARQAPRRARPARTSISAPSPRPPRSTARSTPCSAPSCCAPARTACSRRARGPACSTRSSAARRPASAASTRPEYDAIVDEVRGFLGGTQPRGPAGAVAAHGQGLGRAWSSSAPRVLRDRIRALAHIQSHQSINLPSIDEADIFAAHAEGGQVCVQVFFLRAGQNLGNRAYFPSHAKRARRRPRCWRPSSASSTKPGRRPS